MNELKEYFGLLGPLGKASIILFMIVAILFISAIWVDNPELTENLAATGGVFVVFAILTGLLATGE